jgi:DNA uptake protein ComE-like DNA-binding protein
MGIRRWMWNFFGFTRGQINGSLVLLSLMVVVIFSQPLYRWWTSRTPRDFSKERVLLDSLAQPWLQEGVNSIPEEEELPVMRFSFNPNMASAEELQALGFSRGLSSRLINYRQKGGTFRYKHDLLKLYGMEESFYRSIEAYIDLPEEAAPVVREERQFIAKQQVEPVRFNLNTADTTLLKSIFGIGSKLSARIVNYREALGGFVSNDQLYAIYGLDSVVVDRLINASFIPEDFQPRKMNLNRATEEELALHPYITRRMARAIVTYRFQHGDYPSVDDLQKVVLLSPDQLNAIRIYLTVD